MKGSFTRQIDSKCGDFPCCRKESPMDNATRDTHVARIRHDGYTIVENAIEPSLIDGLNAALDRLERELDAKPAMNGFEGHKTVRIYNLLRYGEPFTHVPVHASVLPIVERVLDPG